MQKTSVRGKKYIANREGESRISFDFFHLIVQKFFLEDRSNFQKTSGNEKVYGWEGGYQVFPSKFLRLTLPKSFIGNFLVFQKTVVSEKLFGW